MLPISQHMVNHSAHPYTASISSTFRTPVLSMFGDAAMGRIIRVASGRIPVTARGRMLTFNVGVRRQATGSRWPISSNLKRKATTVLNMLS